MHSIKKNTMAKKKTTLKDEISNPSSGFMVPIAILIGGFLIIWGITKMLDGGTSGYKRLVEDLQSKTFGNRWVAAYDLSKYIAGNQIPKEDVAWLIPVSYTHLTLPTICSV